MNLKRAKEYIPFLEAIAEGKTVQMILDNGRWINLTEPGFVCEPDQYRVKPEPKLVPFTFEDRELFRDKWVKVKDVDSEFKINKIAIDQIQIGWNGNYKYETALKQLTFADGKPFGKYEIPEL